MHKEKKSYEKILIKHDDQEKKYRKVTVRSGGGISELMDFSFVVKGLINLKR